MTSIQPDPQLNAKVLAPGQYPRTSAVWVWPLLWLSLLAGSTATGLWAVAWMTRIPPLPDCEQISSFSADSQRLYCVRLSAEAGTEEGLVEALSLISTWSESHPLHQDSYRFLGDWSEALFEKAQSHMQTGAITRAINLAEQIPTQAEIYGQVQSEIATWQGEWEKGNALTEQIDLAIKTRDWSGARQALQEMKLLRSDYWLGERHQFLTQRVKSEQSARQQLESAQTLASSGQIEDIAEAFTQAQAIDVQSRAWGDAEPDLKTWAEALLQYGFQKWEQEDLEAAIAIIQRVPVDLAKAPEAKDLVTFAHAQRLAQQGDGDWLPSYSAMLNLVEARAAVQKISANSPFYEQAQARLDEWAQKLEDTRQLYFANMLAQLGHKPLYEMAIAEAAEITPDRPQRLQAQTLLSHWQKEIERVEDRPFLVRAQELAAAGNTESFQAAIAEARKVELGRALRIEAQTKIAAWLNQIEVIEDQPILDKALALASNGKLQEAVNEARAIEEGRALFAEAQSSIQEWTTTIQIREDRPILQRAEGLAAQGRLSDAIAVASRVGRGRALYGESRNSIALWASQRDAILSSRRQRASVSESSNNSRNSESDESDD